MNRRAFLALGAGAALTGGSASEAAGALASAHRSTTPPQDPRLTARPGIPELRPTLGATRLAPELDRGGTLYVPQGYEPTVPAPLLVALHGGGGRSRSWTRLYEPCEQRGTILLAPESRGGTWDAIRGSFGPDVLFLDSALQYTFSRCVVDPSRIALIGFSDGASYALSLGPSNGDLFTHLMAFSPGFSYPEDPIVGRPRVFVSHGTEDRVLPVSLSRDGIAPMFEMDGYDIRYEEFAGGHETPELIITAALDWFLA